MKKNNLSAFPDNISSNGTFTRGMTLLDYFIAHAPEKPQWEFDVPMKTARPEAIFDTEIQALSTFERGKWDKDKAVKRIKMWATEWAKEQLIERMKHL